MELKQWTPEEMMEEGLCPGYTLETLLKLWAGRESVNLLDIFEMPIPYSDMIWVATRKGAQPKAIRKDYIEDTVTRCVSNHAIGTVIDKWARGWIDGTDRREKSAVEARAVARVGAAAAAWEAAFAAELATRAEAEAPWQAARAGARASSWAAAAGEEESEMEAELAAMAEEYKHQVDYLAVVLKQ